MSTDNYYLNNPLIHSDRRLTNMPSQWVRSFSCIDMRPLIICRGPIRKEVMDVFDEMGISTYGILLSEKDSIIYPNALSPELRSLTDPDRIHRVPDYSGATKEERRQRIDQIIKIAKQNGYNAIFAGYGFMAEDEGMVAAMEQAGLNFIGPCSRTVHSAGLKDEAKRTALKVGVSVTPGIDNATALVLLAKYNDVASLKAVAEKHQLNIDSHTLNNKDISLADKADFVLAASYDAGIDLYTVEELQAQIEKSVTEMYGNYPDNRIRLKAIGGGGGKGQRILAAPSSYQGSKENQIAAAASKAPELVLEILNEVKTTGVGDNKNVLVELNIETTRHQEIQVVGNGDWCITMGARDCSLQMHEQKLLEVSSTHESIARSIECAKKDLAEGYGSEAALQTLINDLNTLDAMEAEAATFGEAVGLDSVSTFECIVDRGSHFFMEMNTRIQVEHRVTELCYGLKFTNPDNSKDVFVVESLVEAMVLLARHGSRLPKPERVIRKNASVEARLNATNAALQPHAGGLINWWSEPIEDEIRDDQGISLHNPDTNVFMKYKLAGAYDSNIALLLTHGDDRLDSFERLA
ncbi:MAG: biotin carboxylase N-terminal domain-containing protein, partial [Pseudomonadales bacterium]|nr:biotin carboxylase N-terminal domain-containing protein [Pseudomonadales bacterium]